VKFALETWGWSALLGAPIAFAAVLNAFTVTQPPARVSSMGSVPSTSSPTTAPKVSEAPNPRAELGRAIFFDANLSEPPGTSCASCHDPEHAFSSSNGSLRGVARGSREGHFARGNAPSLLYLKYTPKFDYLLDDDDAIAAAPHGGFFWDGRSDSIHELVRQPLLNPDEMNNRDAASIAAKIANASYAPAFARSFGTSAEAETTLANVGVALEAFLTSDELTPFTSRFDDYVRGRGKLTPYEMQGLHLFKDPGKGGCIGCHRFYDTSTNPAESMFTDYGYDALAVPRNERLPPGRNPDLGLCERKDRVRSSAQPENCARFRTPSLRNVAVRSSFMHNGTFTSLRDVVAFYATRAVDPKRWYKAGPVFDDVPAQYRKNVNVSSIPYNRRAGDTPPLNDAEIDAIVAFLKTLTDARYEKP